jgi:hypothetical protein
VRLGFGRAAFFLVRGGGAFFRGSFAKNGVFAWCFCGEVVVNCVVNRGALMAAFWRLKICDCFELYFSGFSLSYFSWFFSYFIFSLFVRRWDDDDRALDAGDGGFPACVARERVHDAGGREAVPGVEAASAVWAGQVVRCIA